VLRKASLEAVNGNLTLHELYRATDTVTMTEPVQNRHFRLGTQKLRRNVVGGWLTAAVNQSC
jgi:hypothetical protein